MRRPFSDGLLCKWLFLWTSLLATRAGADNVLHPSPPQLDRPTLIVLGVVLPITGDDNFNAQVTVRYRRSNTSEWKIGLPLFRVHPEVVSGTTIPPQFAGSIFDLRPNTSYDIELHATDPDGPVDQLFTLTGTTRDVPRDPPGPHSVPVSSSAALDVALGNAQPGDVITLAAGTYAGTHSFSASGTSSNPIVVRGDNEDTVILDGADCVGCNVLEVYGSFVHLERMTIQNAERSIRFQNPTGEGNVVRRVHVRNTRLGIHGRDSQLDFYICDNILEGRIAWPLTYDDDGAAHAFDDGIVVSGSGHVVCHNQISGYADALQNLSAGDRSLDFYNNEVLWTYDDGLEFDGSDGNVRAFRNRFSNTHDVVSCQPVQGGPAYAFRNVIINAATEPFKLHSLALSPPEEPSGVLLFHNTIVKPYHDFQLSTAALVHYFQIKNNLFVGPTVTEGGYTFRWDQPVAESTGTVDWNGHYPDGLFEFGYANAAGGVTFPNFAAVQSDGRWESHGVLFTLSPFANGLVGMPGQPPAAGHVPLVQPTDVSLAPDSAALDRGEVLPNINDNFRGAAPDLGALELGCALPLYGVRPDGTDETNESLGCDLVAPPADAGTQDAGFDAGTPLSDGGGVSSIIVGGCSCGPGGGTAWVGALLLLAFALRRRTRSV